MNRKTLVRVLIAEAVLLAALCVLTLLVPSVFSSMLAFPFEQIALGAGAVSRLGSVGNGFAVALLTGLSLIPLFAAFRYPRADAFSSWIAESTPSVIPLSFRLSNHASNPYR